MSERPKVRADWPTASKKLRPSIQYTCHTMRISLEIEASDETPVPADTLIKASLKDQEMGNQLSH